MWYYIRVEFEDGYTARIENETDESFCYDKDFSEAIKEHGKITHMRIVINT